MKIRIFISTILMVLFGTLTLSQISSVKAIETAVSLTGPITGPITSAKYFLRGKVGYRVWDRFIPSIETTVRALNIQTKEVQKTKTNSAGEYSFTLNEGIYRVSVYDTKQVNYDPNKIEVILNSNKEDINFIGTPR